MAPWLGKETRRCACASLIAAATLGARSRASIGACATSSDALLRRYAVLTLLATNFALESAGAACSQSASFSSSAVTSASGRSGEGGCASSEWRVVLGIAEEEMNARSWTVTCQCRNCVILVSADTVALALRLYLYYCTSLFPPVFYNGGGNAKVAGCAHTPRARPFSRHRYALSDFPVRHLRCFTTKY